VPWMGLEGHWEFVRGGESAGRSPLGRTADPTELRRRLGGRWRTAPVMSHDAVLEAFSPGPE